MMHNPSMQKANFDNDGETALFGRIVKRIVKIDSVEATLVRFGVGANVQDDAVAPGLLGEHTSCPLPHVAYILEGAIRIRQDGNEEVFRAGDIMMLPPGHDAWTVGDEDCVFVEFSRGSEDYYGAAELAH